MLWTVLDLVLQDWKREKTPLQAAIDNASDENEKMFHTLQAFSKLQPYYLKCLFSYTMFFIALEGAYTEFYKELNELNRKSFFRVKHDKPPKTTAYIEKVRMIRNISIVHIGSRKESAINSAMAMMWQPMTWSKGITEPWNLDEMTFGEGKLVSRDAAGIVKHQSDDFEIKGILEMDGHCRAYLEQYDNVCADYLKTIHAKLPMVINDEQYYEFK
jgi:hypothetical protein